MGSDGDGVSEDNGNSLDWGAAVETEPWHDAGLAVDAAFERLENARTLLEQADALVDLSNSVSDLRSWLPGYNAETGRVENYDE